VDIIEMKYRYIHSLDDDKYSYQLYNAINGQLLWMPLEWWNTREEAEADSEARRQQLAADLRGFGLELKRTFTGTDLVDFSSLNMQSLKQNRYIYTAVAVSRKNGKFGYITMTNDGRILIPPKEYYDTAMEAYEAVNENLESIVEELHAMGMGDMKFIPPDIVDFNPDDANDGPSIPATDLENEKSLKAQWKPFKVPPGFNSGI
jgi:hypothetical protein